MDFHAAVTRSILYPIDLWRRGGLAELKYLKEFEESQFFTSDRLADVQRKRLNDILRHAYRFCPFYTDRLKEFDYNPSFDIHHEDLHKLPILDKSSIQQYRDRLITSNWPSKDLVANQTGGSTGQPLSFYLSRDRCYSRAASTIRHDRWAGWDIGDKVAYVWGAQQDVPPAGPLKSLRRRLMDRRHFLDAAHITEEKLKIFNHELKVLRPKIIVAYARSISMLARFIKEHSLDAYQPDAIITSAEVLESSDRQLLEEVFGCKVFNRYGSREVNVLASECDRHSGLHIMAECLLVEVVRPDGKPAVPGEKGAILVTDLLNFAMPLIRYRIGDVGSWAAGTCSCGRGLPRLESVSGRVTDFLVGCDGSIVSGVFLATYILAKRPSLGQVQILQNQKNCIVYRICRGVAFDYSQDTEYLRQMSRRYLGEAVSVDFDFVDQILPEPSGKYLLSRSSIAADFV